MKLLCLLLVAVLAVSAFNDFRSENEKNHHTEFRNRDHPLVNMVAKSIVLRRGNSFHFDTECDANRVAVAYLTPKARKAWRRMKWTAKADQSGVVMQIPVNAPVGKYRITACRDVFSAIVLLNPDHQQDPVFMEKNADEYVFNEEGLIWVGSSTSNYGVRWDYSQFDAVNLELAVSALYDPPIEDYGGVNAAANPVFLSRHISWFVADKLCTGRWSEPYNVGDDDGEYKCGDKNGDDQCIVPWEIQNTTRINELFLKNNRRSVQYCQCFVFAALTNTIARALGLPSRAITNFNSAADHNDNGAIDKYYEIDSKGALHELKSGDSTWNFHVWNEAWMKRAPTSKGTNQNGWQAYDGTPQIESEGKYRVGPASLAAVYAEEATEKYDVLFLMASTNAKTNIWMKNATTGKFDLKKTTYNDPFDADGSIGTRISAKKPGPISQNCHPGKVVRRFDGRLTRVRDCSAEVDIVTESYHSLTTRREYEEEQASIRDLFKRSPSDKHADLSAEFIFPKSGAVNNVLNGDVIKVGFSFKNKGTKPLTVTLLYKAKATEYNGNRLGRVAFMEKIITIAPGQTRAEILKILPSDYQSKIFVGKRKSEDFESITFALSAKVKNSPTFWMHEKKLLVHNRK